MSDQFEDVEVPHIFDERQVEFIKSVKEHKKNNPNVYLNPLISIDRGYAASCVDVGFIQTHLKDLYLTDRIKNRQEIHYFIAHCVQRLKEVKSWVNPPVVELLNVTFTTQDDLGRYMYGFGVYYKEGWKLEDMRGFEGPEPLGGAPV